MNKISPACINVDESRVGIEDEENYKKNCEGTKRGIENRSRIKNSYTKLNRRAK